eukprot:356224_1
MAFLARTGLAALRSRAAPTLAQRVVAQRPQVRRFATAPPPGGYQGFEKVVRSVLPENHQISLAFAFIEFGGIFLIVEMSGGDEAEAEPAAAAPSAGTTNIPSIIDEEFEEW